MRLLGCVFVDRKDVHASMKALSDATATVEAGRSFTIFPEGTRGEIGAAPDYKPGIAALYRDLDSPCWPIATNSGVHWPAHGFRRYPGTIVFEFLPPIPAGLKRAEFMAELESRIETASTALLTPKT